METVTEGTLFEQLVGPTRMRDLEADQERIYGRVITKRDWEAAREAWVTFNLTVGNPAEERLWASLSAPTRDRWLRVALAVESVYR